MDPAKVGKTISCQRRKLNMTQLQLAEILNVSNKSVSRWENGVTMPDISLLIPLSDALHITLSELLGENAEASSGGQLLMEAVKMSADQVENQRNSFSRIIMNLMTAGLLTLILAPWYIDLTSSMNLSVIDPPGFYVILAELVTYCVLFNALDQKNRTVNLVSYAPLALNGYILAKNLIETVQEPAPGTEMTPVPVISCVYAAVMIAVHFLLFTKKQPKGVWLFFILVICSLLALIRFWPERKSVEPEIIVDPDPVYIEIYCREDGFVIDAAYRRDVPDGYIYREYSCEGDKLDQKFRDLFASDVLETVYSAADGRDPVKQKEIVKAIGFVRSGTTVTLQGFTIDAGMAKKQDDILLSMVDCDLTDATWSFLNARELHLVRITGLPWYGFAAADMIEALIIDPGKDCTPEEAFSRGYFPEDFTVFSSNPTLTGVTFTVYLTSEELSSLPGNTAVLSSESDTIPESMGKHLPYSLEEIKTFFSESGRKVGVVAIACDN